mgnify:CR=1 FL=1
MREQVNFLGMTSCRGGGAKDDQIIKYIGTYVRNSWWPTISDADTEKFIKISQ